MSSKQVRYLYFDDQETTAQGVKDNLESDYLKIELKRELPWSEIIDELLKSESIFDGLILDWRLDGEDGSKADFSSEALAQQCRMLQVNEVNGRKFGKNFPIILCSSETGFKTVREKDSTSIDLFDGIFEKNELEDQEHFLIALVEAYKFLNNPDKKSENILGLSPEQKDKIDPNIISKIDQLLMKQPHELVLFLLNELLNLKGALINKKILSARLGVKTDSVGWELLMDKISAFKYNGILCVKEIWWADLINEWWYNEFGGQTLKYLTSTERIQLLEEKYDDLKGKLTELELAQGAESKEFWTVCYGTDQALAEIDGFIINKHLHYSWQENEFVCLDEAKKETSRGVKWESLLPFEEERLKLYFK